LGCGYRQSPNHKPPAKGGRLPTNLHLVLLSVFDVLQENVYETHPTLNLSFPPIGLGAGGR
jgi:hypothetical protein